MPLARMSIASFLAALGLLAPLAQAADYRGMTAGWPSYANGYYAANYPANYGAGPAYYVARPHSAQTAYYAGGTPANVIAYVPVRAAYASPTYFAAYGAAPNRMHAAAYAPPTAAYYAPQQAAYYPPATANYAPSYSYSVTPAGSASAGSEAAIAYAQPTAVNYVPARTTYRPAYAAVPVYMARPVVAYQPITAYQPIAAQPATCYQPVVAQPTTCYQPAPATSCGTPSRRPLSWLNPFNWFRRDCGNRGCGPAPVQTAYCQPTGCAQPYYPAQPLVPTIPASPAPTFTPLPSRTIIPGAQPTIPPPPTRIPGTLLPADTAPRLTPGGSFTPVPGGTTTPGTIITPGGTGSFPTGPTGAAPGFGTSGPLNPGTLNPGAFPSGTNYPPTIDPYSSSRSGTTLQPPRAISPATNHSPVTSSAIRSPDLGPALPPSVQTVPDPDANQRPQSLNRAPQLLDPRDKSAARADQRWAVVPAVWPTQHRSLREPEVRSAAATQPAPAPLYDDSGWKSAR